MKPRGCPWPGCKAEPFVHKADMSHSAPVYWVVCDTTETANGRLRAFGHMVVGPEASTEAEAIERWDKRLLRNPDETRGGAENRRKNR